MIPGQQSSRDRPLRAGESRKRQTAASWAARASQYLADPRQHRYFVFHDDAFENKKHYVELFRDRIGFQQVSLLKNLTTVSVRFP
jgi:hypothetical protein